jgi:hypothetical protein
MQPKRGERWAIGGGSTDRGRWQVGEPLILAQTAAVRRVRPGRGVVSGAMMAIRSPTAAGFAQEVGPESW